MATKRTPTQLRKLLRVLRAEGVKEYVDDGAMLRVVFADGLSGRARPVVQSQVIEGEASGDGLTDALYDVTPHEARSLLYEAAEEAARRAESID